MGKGESAACPTVFSRGFHASVVKTRDNIVKG